MSNLTPLARQIAADALRSLAQMPPSREALEAEIERLRRENEELKRQLSLTGRSPQ